MIKIMIKWLFYFTARRCALKIIDYIQLNFYRLNDTFSQPRLTLSESKRALFWLVSEEYWHLHIIIIIIMIMMTKT